MANGTQLVQDILAYLEEDASSGGGYSLYTRMGTIINVTESRINSAVGINNFNTNTVTGTLDASSEFPSVILDSEEAPTSPLYFKIRLGNGVTSNNWKFLLLKNRSFLSEYAPTGTEGEPKYYSFYNNNAASKDNTFPVAPIPSASYDYEILYFYKPTGIAPNQGFTTGGTSWLSNHAYHVLLYGCLAEAYSFMKGESDLMQMYEMKYKEGLMDLVRQNDGFFRNSSYNDKSVNRSNGAFPVS